MHPTVRCDGCNMFPLRGTRYKCLTCPDYNLCTGCQSRGIHSEHDMHAMENCDTSKSDYTFQSMGSDNSMIAVLGPSVCLPRPLPLAAWMLGSGDCCTGDSLYPLSPESVARPRRQFDFGGFLCSLPNVVE